MNDRKPNSKHPILYSFRRCPYAIRARMAILSSGIQVEIRDLILRDKPPSMLEYSPKGTVPVLVLEDERVLDESLDIIHWALSQNDPLSLLDDSSAELIHENDHVFKQHLDHYKYADRFPEYSATEYRQRCEVFLSTLEARLSRHDYLNGMSCRLADIAIFPFIRQFAFVDKAWFDQAPYPQLQAWLDSFLNDDLFLGVMQKYPLWQAGDPVTFFPA